MSLDLDKIRRSVGIIGESDSIQEMLATIGQVANTNILVLVTGDSGSGKEMVARAVHKNSRRKFESLVTVNCAAIPSGIIESELFGIGSTNLVTPKPPVTPELKHLQALSNVDRPIPLIMPQSFEPAPDQRPFPIAK